MINLLFARDERGATAVEFALLAPVFIFLVFGALSLGILLATVHGLQQLAGEAARASVAGLTDGERTSLAQAYVSANVRSYPMIDPAKVTVAAQASIADPSTFEVVVTFDGTERYGFLRSPYLQLPSSIMTRRAAIKRGGY